MYARVARWEGGDGQALRDSADELNGRAASGPPPGVPAKGFLMLIDPDGGRSMAIAFFETQEDLHTGDATLNDMSPTVANTGTRVSVEHYEVGVDVKA